MTFSTQLGGDLTRDDLALRRREARADEDGYKQGIADQTGPTRRKLAGAGAAGAVLVWALGRRRHPLGTLFILGGLAALVAAVAIFWVLVAIALVIGAVAFVACDGRRGPGTSLAGPCRGRDRLRGHAPRVTLPDPSGWDRRSSRKSQSASYATTRTRPTEPCPRHGRR